MNTAEGRKKSRIRSFGIAITVVASLYLGQIFSLQVLDTTQYKSQAAQQSQRALPLPALRGEIYDRRQGGPLATNRSAYAVRFVPGDVPANEVPGVLARLALLLHQDPASLERLVPPSQYSSFGPITLDGAVAFRELQRLAERSSEFPGVTWDEVSVREYRDVGSLASVLGYVGAIDQDELQVMYNSGYDSRSVVGKAGLEKQYDLLLRGKDGVRFQTVDALGRQTKAETRDEPPVQGQSLVLTIDKSLQVLAEKALGDRIGSVVVLKPATGEILALVTSPSYDSEAFSGPEAGAVFRSLLADSRFPFLNRAIQATYPPASTFKVIMSAAVLGEGVFDPKRRVFSGPEYRLGDRSFREHNPRGLGWVDLPQALALSANIYFYTVGVEHLGIERISRYAREFGLGRATGVDLPEEAAGQVPDPAWKQSNLRAPWVGGDTANTSIGQGYLQVTPLQMANAMALVANEGKVYRPHLLKKVVDPSGPSTDEPEPDLLFQSALPASVYRPLQEALRGVVVNGTAAAVVTTTAVQVAGKTGTGEDGLKGSSNHSWFVAYAPYDDPDPDKRIVVVVQVERTNAWEWWAPKAANLIFQGIFARQTYEEALAALGPRWG